MTSLGFSDVANRKLHWERHSQNFGQTLGTWGVNSGPYVMLPLLGPSTLRDSAGKVVDQFGRVQHYIDKD